MPIPRSRVLLAALIVVGAVTVATAAPAKEPILEYRQGVMGAIGGHTEALKNIITAKVAFADDAKAHVLALGALAKMTDHIFPPGSDKGETDALPAIWEKPAEFAKARSALQAAAAELSKQADASPKAMAEPFEALVKACKGCHDNFRKKE